MPRLSPRVYTLIWLLPLCADAADPQEILKRIRVNDTAWLEANLTGKADAETPDSRQYTPLIWAAALGSPEAVRILIQKGADVNGASPLGITPLIAASTDPAKVKLLLAAGAQTGPKTKMGHHALSAAASAPRSSESLRALLAAGAKVNEPGAIAMTPILAATFFECGETNVKTLLASGADAKAVGVFGFGAAHGVSSCGPATIADLLARGANPNQQNKMLGQTRFGNVQIRGVAPLHLAAAHGPTTLVRLLLDQGASVHLADERKMTPLLAAVSSEDQNAATVKLLLERGADREAKDQFGQNALDWARKFNNPAVLALLGEKPAPRELARLDSRGPGAAAALSRLETGAEDFFKASGCLACHHSNLSSFALDRAAKAGLNGNPELLQARRQRLRGMLISYVPTYLQQIGPPGDLDSVLYSLLEANALGIADSPEVELAAKYAMSRQLENGSWSMRGISRAPMEESDLHRTALAIWLLPRLSVAAQRAEVRARVAEGLRWLSAQQPRNTDEFASKLLGLRWGGAAPAEIEKAARTLEAAQGKDGGWGGNPHLSSDAYSTGLALFALREGGARAKDSKPLAAGVRWLISQQKPDGTWYVKSRAVKFQPYFESGFPYGQDQWISASATAWALAGLSEVGAIQ